MEYMEGDIRREQESREETRQGWMAEMNCEVTERGEGKGRKRVTI